jgi:hypothetical protein
MKSSKEELKEGNIELFLGNLPKLVKKYHKTLFHLPRHKWESNYFSWIK